MDINDNIQINTFTKGMNTDTSDMLLGDGQYRYAENLRVTADRNSDTGEMHIIDGTECTYIELGGEILSLSCIRDICVAIVYHDAEEDTPATWSILKWKSGANTAETIFGKCAEPIWEFDENDESHEKTNSDKSIVTVLRWESSKNIKLYIADGIHELMSINIADNPIIAGLSGLTIDNIFEMTFLYQGSYLPKLNAELLNSDTGHITAGVVQYVYRFYIQNGAASKLSPLSDMISIYKNQTEGYDSMLESTKAIQLSLNDISTTDKTYILIYRINYVKIGQLPQVDLIVDTKCYDGIQVTDFGNSIERIDDAEFLALINTTIIPKQIESKGDILFEANVKYNIDEVDKQFESFDAKSYSTGNQVKIDDVWVNMFNIVGSTYSGGRYGALNENISFDVDYDINDILNLLFDGNNFEYNSDYWIGIIPPTSEQLRFGLENKFVLQNWRINGYGKNIWWAFTTDERDNHIYRPGEVYRFGIRLFNELGNASSVKWIADIQIPKRYDTHYSVLFIVALPEHCSGYEIVRCERTVNDKYTLFQGLTGFAHRLNGQYFNPGFFTLDKFRISGAYRYLLEGSDEIKQSYIYGNAMKRDEVDNKLLMFACPELCYQEDDVKQILNNYRTSLKIDVASLIFTPLGIRDMFMDGDYTAKIGPRRYNGRKVAYYFTHPINTNNGNVYLSERANATGRHNALAFNMYPNENDSNKLEYRISFGNVYMQCRGKDVEDNDYQPSLYGAASFDNVGMTYNNVFLNHFHNYNGSLYFERPSTFNIKDLTTVKSSDYNKLVKLENTGISFLFKSDGATVDNKTFTNWSTPILNHYTDFTYELIDAIKNGWDKSDEDYVPNLSNGGDTENYANVGWSYTVYPIGYGGPLMLLNLDGNDGYPELLRDGASYDYSLPRVYISDVKKNSTPYGGYNKTAIDKSVYYSYGDYFDSKDSTFTGEANVGTITVKSGDCFYTQFTYNALHWWWDALYNKNTIKMSTIYTVPLYTEMDLRGQSGYLFRVGRDVNTQTEHKIQNKAVANVDGYTQSKDMYIYNTAYSAQPTLIPYTSEAKTTADTGVFDTRIHYSQPKINNEMLDNWTLFRSNNFIDVDSRFGEITDLKLFKDKLLFWQENAAGVLSVNDRTILNSMDDAQIILGSGGILDRYDYLTNVFGERPNQHTVCTTNNSVYWWDEHRREIVSYSEGYQATPLSTVKNIKNYLSNKEINNNPTISYDQKHNEVLCGVVGENESVVYNEYIQAFTSVYTFSPLFYAQCGNILYMTNKSDIYKYNSSDSDSDVTLFGNGAFPSIEYVVNKNSSVTKTYDIQTLGGRFYGGGYRDTDDERNINPLKDLKFSYSTPLKQIASVEGEDISKIITNAEYDFRLQVPRVTDNNYPGYGGRLKGKVLRGKLSSKNNNSDFSLQYITTKFRTSWI